MVYSYILYLTNVNDAALFATVAFIFVKLGNQLPDDSNIIQIWLYTVVWTSAHGDFELVRQFYRVVALVETMVNFLGDGEGIQKAILTGGAFAGDHRTNHGTSTSGFEPWVIVWYILLSLLTGKRK